MTHQYDDATLRVRINRILGSNEAQGREKLAVRLLLSPSSIDEALGVMKAAGRSRSTMAALDVDAIYRRRAEAESGHAREVFADNERAHYRDPTTEAGAAAIYARRAEQAKQAATGPGF
jgi:hypothetical protein